jgi:hypothetical protein
MGSTAGDAATAELIERQPPHTCAAHASIIGRRCCVEDGTSDDWQRRYEAVKGAHRADLFRAMQQRGCCAAVLIEFAYTAPTRTQKTKSPAG